MNLREETERIILEGYNEANAQSKLCQDIVLKAISDSGMAKNATIKGGVVMRSISGNARRATQDIDIDLIRYSISVDNMLDVIERLEKTFNNPSFIQNVNKSRRNWLDMSAEEVLAIDLALFRRMK